MKAGRMITAVVAVGLSGAVCSSTPSSLTPAEQKYVYDVRSDASNSGGTDAEIARTGERICQSYRTGSNSAAINLSLQAAGYSTASSVSLNRNATADLCPQFAAGGV